MAHEHVSALDSTENMEESEVPLHASTNKYSTTGCERLSMLVRDEPNWLYRVRRLEENDTIILLTPLIYSSSQDPAVASDPFQSLESSLSNRHSQTHQINYIQRSGCLKMMLRKPHLSDLNRDGITQAHIDHIKRSQVIVLCFVLRRGDSIPTEIANNLFAVSDNKPTIILICCKPLNLERKLPFPCVIQTFGYSPPALEATAALIFGEDPAGSSINLYLNVPVDTRVPREWPIELWNEARDMPSIAILWRECFDTRFWIPPQTLSVLLRRPSYAKHYVVRHSISGQVLGFCATFLSPADQKGERVIASLALILVRSLYREEGIGLSLHSHAIEELKKNQCVTRIQLGSTFPQIFYGLLQANPLYDEWFRRRGWPLHGNIPGQGRTVCDLILNLSDWRLNESVTTLFGFRRSTPEDMTEILEFLKKTCLAHYIKMGWYDLFLKQLSGPNIDEIVLATEDQAIVAIALTYTPQCSNILEFKLPWASIIGPNVGGVTCMCLPVDRAATARKELRNGLIDISVGKLRGQGMTMLFLDSIVDEIDDLRMHGFHEWARYSEVWMDLININ